MINLKNFSEYIVQPTLYKLNMFSLAAERLLIGTALTESNLHYLKQINGPALGLYQMEPATHNDIWENYLRYRPKLTRKLRVFLIEGLPKQEQLIGNLTYATAMARLHYKRIAEPLPDEDDADAMAQYHKKYYNTHLGKTEPHESVTYFKKVIKEMRLRS